MVPNQCLIRGSLTMRGLRGNDARTNEVTERDGSCQDCKQMGLGIYKITQWRTMFPCTGTTIPCPPKLLSTNVIYGTIRSVTMICNAGLKVRFMRTTKSHHIPRFASTFHIDSIKPKGLSSAFSTFNNYKSTFCLYDSIIIVEEKY